MGTKMRPSHANLFVSFIEHQFFVNKTARPFSQFLRLRRLYCYDSDFSEKSIRVCWIRDDYSQFGPISLVGNLSSHIHQARVE